MRCLICNKKTKRKYGIYCDDGCRKKLGINRETRRVIDEEITDNYRWVHIYKYSSIESLRELARMKNTIPKQANRYQDLLIYSTTVMSNFK